jgi:hypothetical protein
MKTAVIQQTPWEKWKQTTHFIVDSYHYINHKATDQICRTWCNPSLQDGSAPNLVSEQIGKDGNTVKVREFNTEAYEQLNAWLGGFESILKCMTVNKFNWFLYLIIFYHVKHVLQKMEKSNLSNPTSSKPASSIPASQNTVEEEEVDGEGSNDNEDSDDDGSDDESDDSQILSNDDDEEEEEEQDEEEDNETSESGENETSESGETVRGTPACLTQTCQSCSSDWTKLTHLFSQPPTLLMTGLLPAAPLPATPLMTAPLPATLLMTASLLAAPLTSAPLTLSPYLHPLLAYTSRLTAGPTGLLAEPSDL